MKKYLALLLLFTMSLAHATSSRTLEAQFIKNGAGVLTLPSSTDTVLGRATTDTLSNKSMSGAANTFTLIPVGAIGNGSVLSGSNSGDVTIGTANGLSLSGQALSLQLSSSSQPGALSAADWATFNAKLTSVLADGKIFIGNGSNVAVAQTVSGDITISNTGVVAIGAQKVEASMLDSGAASAGYAFLADGAGSGSYQAIPSAAPALNGGSAAPQAITAAGGISLSGISYSNFVWVIGSPGAVTVTATPSITACTADGQTLKVIGTDATKTVKLQDQANLAGSGLDLNGDWIGGLNSVLDLHCDITAGLWIEDSRR